MRRTIPLAVALCVGATACSSDSVGPTVHAPSALFAFGGNPNNVVTTWFQGFETNTADWSDGVARVASGTNGVPSADGAFHEEAPAGSFSRFGAYSGVWPGDYVAEVDVYLDPAWAVGQGFDYSVASSNSSGGFLRDFIFHLGVVPDGRLLVNADNNSYGGVNAFVLQTGGDGTPYHVVTAGWYTLQHVFYDDGGVLAVDMNLLDASGTVLFTITRSNAADLIAGVVGGNRYAWFVLSTRTLAIDNHRLGTVILLPGSKDDCKKGGWQAFGFRNQGQCVASFNHS